MKAKERSLGGASELTAYSSRGNLANRAVRSELILTKMRIGITIAIVRAKQPAAGELWYGWG